MKDGKFIFQGKGMARSSEGWKALQRICLDRVDDPEDYYIEDPGLVMAVNTALGLGMPLLVTGAPGVGKTQLAYRIAYELGCGEPIFFPVKSGSEAQDLFYHVDHLRRLHAAYDNQKPAQNSEASGQRQNKVAANGGKDILAPLDIRHFIHFQGLGLAILRALPEQRLRDLGLWDHAWPNSDVHNPGFGQRRPSVVLIDEIDKAPVDLPNDLLEEIRKLEFSVPEMGGGRISLYANPTRPTDEELRYRPQIIITSNSEKGLPEPFLRRCIYYHIENPVPHVLRTIIEKRLRKNRQSLNLEFQNRCVDFFTSLRENPSLEKAPSTGELLSWLLILSESDVAWKLDDLKNEPWRSIAGHCLLKTEQDKSRLNTLIDSWPNRG